MLTDRQIYNHCMAVYCKDCSFNIINDDDTYCSLVYDNWDDIKNNADNYGINETENSIMNTLLSTDKENDCIKYGLHCNRCKFGMYNYFTGSNVCAPFISIRYLCEKIRQFKNEKI